MKNRAKPVETEQDESYTDNFHCKKHPFASTTGICAYCLKERLLDLVCTDCGEQRLFSSCSCSEISSSFYANDGFNGNIEIGSVGRVSFLIENEKTEQRPSFFQISKANLFNRSFSIKSSNNSSIHAGIKRNYNGFCKIVNFFKKKSDFDEKGDVFSVSDKMGVSVSRSRSICSFMGVDCMSVNGSLAQDSGKKSGFSKNEARKSGFGLDSENEVKMKENEFVNFIDDGDDSGFIELKADVIRSSFGSSIGDDDDEIFSNGSPCRRIIVNEGRIKKSRKSLKVWRWIFRNHHRPEDYGSKL